MVFGNCSWKIMKGNMVVAQGSKMGALYLTTEKKDIVAMIDCGYDLTL